MTHNARARLIPISVLACAAFLVGGAYALAQTNSDRNPAPKATAKKPAAKKPAAAKTPATAKKKTDTAKNKTEPTKAAKKKTTTPKKAQAKAESKGASAKAAPKSKSAKDTSAPKAASKRATAAKKKRKAPTPARQPAASDPGVTAVAAPASAAPSAASAGGFGAGFFATAAPMAVAPAVDTQAAPETGASSPLAYAPSAQPSASDVDAVKEAINLARRGSTERATERRDQIRDSAARRLVEWVILRSADSSASFARYAAFVREHPNWPSQNMIRRRAEGQLWTERREPGTVFAFFSNQEPLSSKGRLAMARAALVQGDRAAAQRYAREAWRSGEYSQSAEEQVLESFGPMLTSADHKARMDARLYADDFATATRAAQRLGAAQVAIVKARAAAKRRAGNAGALIEAVPQSAHSDPAYLFTKIQWLRKQDRIAEAGKLALAAPHDSAVIHDADEWWIERRLVLRKLLDAGDARSAYRVARDAAPPSKEMLAVDRPFTAGWIALRFLNDPAAAARHFAEIRQVSRHPTSVARADYWLGRTAETAGRRDEARRYYEAAAQHTAAYYGQLARARLGYHEMTVRRPPALSATQLASLRNVDLVRAVELLYATDNRDLVVPFVTDLDRVSDVGVLTVVADIVAKHDDAHAMLHLGKDAISRGLTFDHYAFPGVGVPKFASIGPATDRSLVYAITRQESAFKPRAVSTARAMGLMQVTAGTGRGIARKHGVKFDAKRLLNDSTYNVQLGAAEITNLLSNYDGNYVLAFVGYNAGPGRAREWVEKYGDPRDPKVDVVDWVERIPITETRNYVQRVMENMQVYRARFGDRTRLTIDTDMRGARQ